ncbi:MAG: GDP-mannose 4,6-dehydratase [Verrucomicrobia bacterium]|nr:GDP-mannose 4,6-dehydratase [Verrucomicrobiota bacterium]
MNLLVTGGAGFIGSHLVERLLADGHRVTVVDDFNDFYSPERKDENLREVRSRIAVHRVGLHDRAALERIVGAGGFEAIVHLAARAGVRPSIQQPHLYVETNVVGTLNLLEAARLAKVPRFVFGSSSSVYGLCRTIPFREDVPLQETISPYAATKLAGEQLCSNYAHLHGLRCVCLRFFTVYGPRQRPDLAIHQFTERISAGRPIRQFGDGSTRRDYTYVDDIVSGIVGALGFEGPIFEVFNLGGSETTSLATLIGMIESLVGRAAVIEHLPEQPGDLPVTYADISKARAALGYAPQTPLKDGLAKFVDWFHDWQAARTLSPMEVSQ